MADVRGDVGTLLGLGGSEPWSNRQVMTQKISSAFSSKFGRSPSNAEINDLMEGNIVTLKNVSAPANKPPPPPPAPVAATPPPAAAAKPPVTANPSGASAYQQTMQQQQVAPSTGGQPAGKPVALPGRRPAPTGTPRPAEGAGGASTGTPPAASTGQPAGTPGPPAGNPERSVLFEGRWMTPQAQAAILKSRSGKELTASEQAAIQSGTPPATTSATTLLETDDAKLERLKSTRRLRNFTPAEDADYQRIMAGKGYGPVRAPDQGTYKDPKPATGTPNWRANYTAGTGSTGPPITGANRVAGPAPSTWNPNQGLPAASPQYGANQANPNQYQNRNFAPVNPQNQQMNPGQQQQLAQLQQQQGQAYKAPDYSQYQAKPDSYNPVTIKQSSNPGQAQQLAQLQQQQGQAYAAPRGQAYNAAPADQKFAQQTNQNMAGVPLAAAPKTNWAAPSSYYNAAMGGTPQGTTQVKPAAPMDNTGYRGPANMNPAVMQGGSTPFGATPGQGAMYQAQQPQPINGRTDSPIKNVMPPAVTAAPTMQPANMAPAPLTPAQIQQLRMQQQQGAVTGSPIKNVMPQQQKQGTMIRGNPPPMNPAYRGGM